MIELKVQVMLTMIKQTHTIYMPNNLIGKIIIQVITIMLNYLKDLQHDMAQQKKTIYLQLLMDDN